MLRAKGLEGVDAVLEEGAANLEELKVIWGDPSEPLDFDGFCALLSLSLRFPLESAVLIGVAYAGRFFFCTFLHFMLALLL